MQPPPPPHTPLWGGGCDPILHRSIWGGVRFSPPSLYPSGGGSPRSHPRAIPVHPCSVWGGELPYIPPQLLIGVAPVLSHQHPFVRWFGGGGIKFHSPPPTQRGPQIRGRIPLRKLPPPKIPPSPNSLLPPKSPSLPPPSPNPPFPTPPDLPQLVPVLPSTWRLRGSHTKALHSANTCPQLRFSLSRAIVPNNPK